MYVQRDPNRYLFRRAPNRSRPVVVLILLALLIPALFVLQDIQTKRANNEVVSPFEATATPTRTLDSYALEAQVQFDAGNLNAAIAAYQLAVQMDPNNGQFWAELARIQAYSSSLLTAETERAERMQEALASADQAVAVAPDSSLAHAIRAFVLDWKASYDQEADVRQRTLNDAEQEAIRALQLDATSALALAYYAEILVDQLKWAQAEQYIQRALERDDTLMDVHRVNGYVQESLSNYSGAIREYEKAAEINPRLTFLYISIGANLRQLGQHDRALEYFAKAVDINKQIGVKDPIPYLSIAKTYSQMGEFFAAAANVRRALEFNPSSADIYGQLGIVYFKSRNYEGAIPALLCAVRGCDAATSCDVRFCDAGVDPSIEIQGLPLTINTAVYYYTYGSVLAGMHRQSNNYCEEAMKVLGEVRKAFSEDPTIITIIEPSEQICEGYGYTRR
ncbi:MAG TPA: tetratricopeptide repeat protein [Anaerolineaceae bacterium]|nr:tetratricopeptide repeat protein [Anaerolineaceae bacterium]HQF45224.1 tetratricopeptide repeat protein [Anaerolineaceae bacterium]HQJ02386.1 tetratricopeptide repeat protein [Anaerolineaceae bacterium]HQO97016.1 tetratricopeptide repeat protein [Anaerolineaceae bacterium]HQP61347.1 tetratricopeptide repeat protein [Anaerolineaceae bacterium]